MKLMIDNTSVYYDQATIGEGLVQQIVAFLSERVAGDSALEGREFSVETISIFPKPDAGGDFEVNGWIETPERPLVFSMIVPVDSIKSEPEPNDVG